MKPKFGLYQQSSSRLNSTCLILLCCLQLFINLNVQAKTLVSLLQLENLVGFSLHGSSINISTFTRVAAGDNCILLYFLLSSLVWLLGLSTVSSCGLRQKDWSFPPNLQL